jgi:hypothetical protein
LPADAFKLEGANVRTAVVVFDRYRDRPSDFVRAVVDDLAKPGPDLRLHFEDRSFGEARLRLQKLDDSVPFITRAVTGDKSVKVSHDGRRIRLSFACGFNEAMVLNAVFVKRIYSRDGHRLPRGFLYSGPGLYPQIRSFVLPEDAVHLRNLVQSEKAAPHNGWPRRTIMLAREVTAEFCDP